MAQVHQPVSGGRRHLTDSALTDPAFALQRQLSLSTRGGSGGFLSNIHNAYLSAGIGKAYGDVLVTRFRAPTFPDTRPGTAHARGPGALLVGV